MLRSELIHRLQQMPQDVEVQAAYGGSLMWDLADVQLQKNVDTGRPFIELVFNEGWYP